jgi:hypothetical protein
MSSVCGVKSKLEKEKEREEDREMVLKRQRGLSFIPIPIFLESSQRLNKYFFLAPSHIVPYLALPREPPISTLFKNLNGALVWGGGGKQTKQNPTEDMLSGLEKTVCQRS